MVIHPNMSGSVVNKRWLQELQQQPEKFTVHDLHASYPTGHIDVQKEQALLEQYDTIVFQFPFYWFNCPPLFKTWLDEVLTYGWAYGSKSGYKMANKKVALALSVGIEKDEYTATGTYHYTLQELTAPFEITFQYVRSDYQPLFAYYGLEHRATPDRITQSAKEYLTFMDSLYHAQHPASAEGPSVADSGSKAVPTP